MQHTTAIATLVLSALLAPPVAAQGEPFPVEKSVVNRDDGVVWYVDGRQRIPSHVKVHSLRACRIVARGEEAVLEVEGELDLRAATGGNIELVNVWIEPRPGCKDMVLLNCSFEGGGLRTSAEGAADLDILLHSARFGAGARLDLDLLDGEFNILSSSFVEPVVIRGAAKDEKSKNLLDLRITGCKGGGRGGRGGGGGGPSAGFGGGLRLEGVRKAMVRSCSLGGEESVFLDCEDLAFDANLAGSQRVEFRYSEPRSFGGVEIATTDFKCGRLVLFQPASLRAPQKVRLEKCWFDGRTEEERVRAEILEDAENNPESGVLASLFKIQEQPLGFGGRVR
jgi:hypothetical protein